MLIFSKWTFFFKLCNRTGYTTLSKEVTYNGGEKYSAEDSKKEIPQYPDPYEDMYVVDGLFGEVSILTFTGGQAPIGKNYIMVQHKGLYVRRISFISSLKKLSNNSENFFNDNDL